MNSKFVAPKLDLQAFTCPACGAYSQQRWFQVLRQDHTGLGALQGWKGAICTFCHGVSQWLNDKMVYPAQSLSPPPSEHLPPDVALDYEEARAIVAASPRGAAALLRLALQKMCIDLDEPGENLNRDIKSLVAKGLPPNVEEALNVVRVIGNHAVHPGQIDLNDDPEIAIGLFALINFIAEKMIGEPNEITRMNALLPGSLKP